jgi:hypothetical protein
MNYSSAVFEENIYVFAESSTAAPENSLCKIFQHVSTPQCQMKQALSGGRQIARWIISGKPVIS